MARRKNKTTDGSEQVDISTGTSETETEIKKKEKIEVDLGLDISTSIIGVCVLNHDTGELLSLSNIKLNTTKFKTLWEKADAAKARLSELKKDNPSWVYRRIFVEANAKRFSPGFSSADTILTLAKMNGIVSYLARNALSAEPVDINVVSARARLGIKIDRNDRTLTTKEKCRIEVLKLYPDLPLKKHIAKIGKSKGQEVVNKECEDEIDAFVIVKGGQVIHV